MCRKLIIQMQLRAWPRLRQGQALEFKNIPHIYNK